MITIIAGSRGLNNLWELYEAMNKCPWIPSVVVSGCCLNSPDKLGEFWAAEKSIPVLRYPAEWNKYGKQAGFLRNVEMAKVADALIVLWDGKSKGTKHMIDVAKKYNLKIYIHEVSK